MHESNIEMLKFWIEGNKCAKRKVQHKGFLKSSENKKVCIGKNDINCSYDKTLVL